MPSAWRASPRVSQQQSSVRPTTGDSCAFSRADDSSELSKSAFLGAASDDKKKAFELCVGAMSGCPVHPARACQRYPRIF